MRTSGIIMLKKSSLERKKFKKEELTLIQKLDLKELTVAMPENLTQLLIWTSDLAQYDHAMFIKNIKELEIIVETDQKKSQQLQDQINFYRKRSGVENQTKDFYLNKLLNEGDVVVQGYIKHPTKTHTKYAVISYHGYNFITFATPEIIAKFPIHFIDFKHKDVPQTLTEIHADEEELLSKVRDFVKAFRKQYKEWVKNNKLIKEHNAVMHEIYIKIKNEEAELIKDVAVDTKQDVPKVKEKITAPVAEKAEPIQSINNNEKSITVIKKRKFALAKDK